MPDNGVKPDHSIAIRAKQVEGKWYASYEGWKSVLGYYPTEADAIAAGRDLIAMLGTKRICTPAEIDRVRKEIAR